MVIFQVDILASVEFAVSAIILTVTISCVLHFETKIRYPATITNIQSRNVYTIACAF